MFDWIIDFLRSLFFSLAQLGGFIADSIYAVLKTIVTLDIGDFGSLWVWYAIMISFVGLFTIVRVVSMWIKASFNEEYRSSRYKPFQSIVGVFLIMLTMAVFPLAAKYVTSVSQYSIENVGIFLGDSNISEANPTTIITTNLVNGLKEKGESNSLKADSKDVITINELAAKLNTRENKKYVYLPEFWHIFLFGGVIIFFGFGMVLLAFQFVKRLYAIIVKIVIAPIPVSSLVNNDSDAFGVWLKMLVADALTNFIQYLMLFITLMFSTSNYIVQRGFFVSAVVLLGGLLFLLEGIPQLAQLIGGDVSSGGALQQLSTIRMATSGFSRGLSNMVSFGAGAAVTAGAFGIYSAGRSAGGKSLLQTGMNTLNSINNVGSNGSMTNSHVKDYFKNDDAQSGGLSKPNTLANHISNYSKNATSKRAVFANVASNVGRHLYQKSANRLSNNKLANGLHQANNARKVLKNSFQKPNIQSMKNETFNQNKNTTQKSNVDPFQKNQEMKNTTSNKESTATKPYTNNQQEKRYASYSNPEIRKGKDKYEV